MKYGYDSPDSFTKAFSRFHGYTPLAVRKNKTMIKTFAPLKLTISLKGGYIMDYRIVKKEAFTVLGASRNLPMKMQNKNYLYSGRSIIPRERANMSAACSALTLTRKWEMKNLNI